MVIKKLIDARFVNDYLIEIYYCLIVAWAIEIKVKFTC